MTTMDPDQIYLNFTKEAVGTAYLQAAQGAAKELASDYEQDASAVQKLADTVATGWTGRAAQDATQALAPLAVNLYQGSEELATTQDLISRQIGSFHATANRVQPVPPQPTLQDPTVMLVEGQDPSTMLGQQQSYLSAANNNVDAMHSYQNDSSYNTTNLPPMDPELQSVDTPVAISSSVRTGPTGDAHRVGGVSSNGRAVAGSGTGSTASVSGSAPAGGSGSVGESAPSAAGTPGTSGGSNPLAPTAPGASSGTTSSGTPAEDTFDTVAPLTSDSALGQDAGSAGPGSPTFAGFGPVGMAEVPPGGPQEEGAVPRGPGAVAQAGNRLGRAGTSVSEEDGAAGATTRGAATGLPGSPLGRGGRKDGDGEHRRRYPYRENATELFLAGLPKVAPSVVGEARTDQQDTGAPEAEQ